eukprot:4222807-Amphidinium_carterae.1
MIFGLQHQVQRRWYIKSWSNHLYGRGQGQDTTCRTEAELLAQQRSDFGLSTLTQHEYMSRNNMNT